MAVQEVFANASQQENRSRDNVLWMAELASDQNTLDPVDKAIHAATNLHETPGRLIREYPLSSDCSEGRAGGDFETRPHAGIRAERS